ncbi:hypothetical protein KY321_04750 [Candidatus Woesearchaeota archaeon]|nr:hypothetical protein [Candidatus Woesearchaeota archaeon]
MNKKGISDGYMLVIQLIAIGLIFTLLIYKVNQLDLDAIHRTIASKDLALSFSTISFLPGSFTFGGFTPEYANKLTKKEFYVKLSVDKIAYFEDIPSQNELKLSPDSYSFFSNKRVDYSDYLENEDADTMSYHDVRIKKSERVDLTNDRELGELDCRSESKKYYIKT